MARYRMDDGIVVDTDRATTSWRECHDWDGSNRIGRSSMSQWHDQALHRSRKGRYYLEHTSRVQGECGWCEWISPEQAAAWLTLNEKDVPPDLAEAADRSTE